MDVGGSTVDRQCVELATYISYSFVSDPNSDGLLGLGFSSISQVRPQRQKTFFENVMEDLTEPLFTADLEDDMGKGTYEFGRIDSSKYKGEVHYAPVDTSNGWWQIESPTFMVGNETHACQTCNGAIADTGTSLLYLDQEVVDAYYEGIDTIPYGNNILAYPCNTTLPDLGIAIGEDYTAVIRGEDMTYLDLGDTSPRHEGYCMGGLQAGPGDIQILGDVFLKQFFAIFDGGKMRFGIAEKH